MNYSEGNTEYSIKKFTYFLSNAYKEKGYKLSRSFLLISSPVIQFRAISTYQEEITSEVIVIPLISNRAWNKLGVCIGLRGVLSGVLSVCKQRTDTNKIYYYYRCSDYGHIDKKVIDTLLDPGYLHPIIDILFSDLHRVGMTLRKNDIRHVLKYSDMHNNITAQEELQIINDEPN